MRDIPFALKQVSAPEWLQLPKLPRKEALYLPVKEGTLKGSLYLPLKDDGAGSVCGRLLAK